MSYSSPRPKAVIVALRERRAAIGTVVSSAPFPLTPRHRARALDRRSAMVEASPLLSMTLPRPTLEWVDSECTTMLLASPETHPAASWLPYKPQPRACTNPSSKTAQLAAIAAIGHPSTSRGCPSTSLIALVTTSPHTSPSDTRNVVPRGLRCAGRSQAVNSGCVDVALSLVANDAPN